MKKVKIYYCLFLVLMCLYIQPTKMDIHANANDFDAPLQTYLLENENVDAFYTSAESGSVEGLKNIELLEQLSSIMSEKHRYYTSYGECRGAMAFSDEDENDEDSIRLFYAGVPFSNIWGSGYNYNREHVWCKSLSGGLFTSVTNTTRNAGTDIHQIKPSIPSINSTRNNFPYADLNHQGTEIYYQNQKTGNYFANNTFEPKDDIKGDIARILMYMYTHYSTEVANSTPGKNGDLDITNIVYTNTNTAQDSWNLLLDWNKLDPVDEFEIHRNDYCASITGVRNPYIDHPEFATMIWNANYDGKGALLDEDVFTLQKTSITLSLKDTYQIAFQSSHDASMFHYTSSNENIVRVTEDGFIQAINIGKAYIYISNQNYSQCLSINVIDQQQQFTIHYYLNDGTNQCLEQYTTPISYGNLLTKPDNPTREGYTFLYWSIGKDQNAKAYDFSKAVIESFDLYAIWQIAATWKKVNRQDDLNVNQTYILVASQYDKALSITQNTNNRLATNIEKISEDTLKINDNVQYITLSQGIEDNTYALRVTDGYLYAAGGTQNNYLKTQSSLTLQSSFTIDILQDGKASIVCVDEKVTRNTLRYNAANDLFSCYLSNNRQYDVSLYQLISFNSDFKTQMQFAFEANYDNGELSNFTHYQMIFKAYLPSSSSNNTFGCICLSQFNLIQFGYTQFIDVYKENQEDLERTLNELDAKNQSIVPQNFMNQWSLQFVLEDLTSYQEVYSIIFYEKDEKTQQYTFSKQIDISFLDLVKQYIEEDERLDVLENKDEIIAALLKIQEMMQQ